MHLCYNTQQEIQPDLPHRMCHGLSHARACVYILAGGPCPSLVSCLSSSESSRRRQSAHLLTPPHPLPHVQLSETIPVGITFPSFQYKQYKLVCPRVRIFVRCWSVACNCLIRSCHVYHRRVKQTTAPLQTTPPSVLAIGQRTGSCCTYCASVTA